MQSSSEKQLIDSILTLLNAFQKSLVDQDSYRRIVMSGYLRNWQDRFLKNQKEADEFFDRSGFETLRALAGRADWKNFLNELVSAVERFAADDRIQ